MRDKKINHNRAVQKKNGHLSYEINVRPSRETGENCRYISVIRRV